MKVIQVVLLGTSLLILAPRLAGATFHFMQIEQVIGGVDGHTDVQAVQLRMRALGQNLVQNARLYAWDATGANPVLLIDIVSSVPNGQTGDRVLIATSNFPSFTSPALTPDFVFTNPIPASYLAAGSVTFEDDFGTVLWRLSWGGATYTGSNLGSINNDADGNFGPPFPGALPSAGKQAVLFKNSATAPSTNNLNDYILTAGAATFTNNARASGTIINTVGVGDGPAASLQLSGPTPNPVRGEMAYGVTLPRASRVRLRLLDLEGRVMRKLVDHELSAGRHTFTWRPDDGGPTLSSGLYFLELTADGGRKMRRVALIR